VRILTHLFSFYLPSTLYCVFHRFCYGGKFCVDFNTKGLVDATVACHPSFTNVASYDNLKAPILFNLAETDDLFPKATSEQVKKNLDSNSSAPAHDFKTFDG
jgi:dienelactone hydrolase